MMYNFLIEKAHAVQVGVCPDGNTDCSSGYNWHSYIEAILSFAQKLGIAIVVLSVIYAGFVYVTSRGDSSKISTAKDRVIGAIVGYILLLLVGTIYNYISLSK